jgi:heptosyltransferase-1
MIDGMKAPQRILIIRLSAIGDIIMASGLIPALRKLWPEARIAWLAEESQTELLRHNPRLDRVIGLPRGRWRGLRKAGRYREMGREVAAMIRMLRDERYDLVLDLQGLLKSGVWARATGAARRIGLGSREGSQWLMTEVIPREMEDPRIGKEYRDLAVRLGARPESFVMDIAVPEATRDSAAALRGRSGIAGDYVVLAPFTTRPQKHWFDERWAELARRLQPRFTPVLLGGPGDMARAAAIETLSGGGVVNLAGQTTLTECAALIESARALVGVDTGLTHLGLAMATPTLALFGSTMPYLDTSRAHSRVLYVPRACSPCHRRPTCAGRFDCMRAHDVESVLGALTGLVG